MKKLNPVSNIIILLILVYLCLFMVSLVQKSKEGMKNTFYKKRPKSIHHYNDNNGLEIVTLADYGKCLVINGEIQLCEKKEYIYHEMLVHFPIQYLKNNIEYVTIIGGGDLMTLREIMKYKTIKKVFMLELSKEIVQLCQEYFDQDDFSDDDRVEIIYGDANVTIHTLLEEYKHSMDLVIVDSTEDSLDNLSIDSTEFFYKCFELLHENGVIVKNGVFFKQLFQSYDDITSIAYNADIPYFQEKYFFIVLAKPENDIKKKEIDDSRWNYYKINTKFYDFESHNDYIIHEDYVVQSDKPIKLTHDDTENINYKLFFRKEQEKAYKQNLNEMRPDDDDIFVNLL